MDWNIPKTVARGSLHEMSPRHCLAAFILRAVRLMFCNYIKKAMWRNGKVSATAMCPPTCLTLFQALDYDPDYRDSRVCKHANIV